MLLRYNQLPVPFKTYSHIPNSWVKPETDGRHCPFEGHDSEIRVFCHRFSEKKWEKVSSFRFLYSCEAMFLSVSRIFMQRMKAEPDGPTFMAVQYICIRYYILKCCVVLDNPRNGAEHNAHSQGTCAVRWQRPVFLNAVMECPFEHVYGHFRGMNNSVTAPPQIMPMLCAPLLVSE